MRRVVCSASVPVHRQSSDGGLNARNMMSASDQHEAWNKSSKFDSGRDTAVRQAGSMSSISGDSNDDGHKQRGTGSSHDKSNQHVDVCTGLRHLIR